MIPTVAPNASATVQLGALREDIEQRLAALVPASGPEAGVAAAMHAAVMTPGKRLRPLLMLATGQALGCRSPGLLDLACAIEMVHCASLVLDDMPAMDDARLRRGQPTVHLRFGEDVAMLAAVALVSESCRVAALAPGLRPAVRVRIVQALCETIGPAGLVHGQYRDLREGDGAGAWSAREVAEVNDQKTGLLFAAAMDIAARAAGAGAAVPALRRAALAIGQAFQLRDDLDDLATPDHPVTEDPMQDTGKRTLVALAGAAAVRQAIDAQLAKALQELRTGLGNAPSLLPQLLALAFPESAVLRLPAGAPLAAEPPSAGPRARVASQGLAA
ncbi:MAG: polyprenyl synthetase family protein [Comamonadaceae bacterium]|nr:MAG: polyprenyl synthetase family protein [Comamonadaceae bacterium]